MGITSASPAPVVLVSGRAKIIPKGILHAHIMHVRFKPKRYVLRHRLWYLCVPISALSGLNRVMLGYNRARLFSLRDRDYGNGKDPLDVWLGRAFAEAGIEQPAGETILVTLPRVLGFGFNPVSFWLCHDRDGQLRAALAEVNNTFGERHCYLACKGDRSVIGPEDEIRARKVFHVSPFLPVEGEYVFRFIERDDELAIRIDVLRAGTRVMSATINGRFAPLSNKSLAACFVRYPVPAVQVLGFIHYHAMRLYLMGLQVFQKPSPPAAAVSVPLSIGQTQGTSET